jgi:phosphoribosylaminoimidazole-succinocarboxamide synthase
MDAVAHTNLEGLKLAARGKVRDVYDLGDELLIVATDRISAFDHILGTPIPRKGEILTKISVFWFEQLSGVAPHHLITADVDEMPAEVRRHADVVRGRSMLCRKTQPFAAECIVRGYLVGSGWKDYQATGAVCGVALPSGMSKGSPIAPPIFTPSTKAEAGDHDENIDAARFAEVVGPDHAAYLTEKSLEAFQRASEFAAERGVIICDTKLEWGLRDGEAILIDEVFTPDSSRFWKREEMEAAGPGEAPSFDKQVVRDWLESTDWDKTSPPPAVPQEILDLATQRYREIYTRLTGRELS